MLAAHNSKTINNNAIKFGSVAENHKLINLVSFNWHKASLRNNDVITVKICKIFTKLSLIKVHKFRDVSVLKSRQMNRNKIKRRLFLI